MRIPTLLAIVLPLAALPDVLRGQENLFPQASVVTGVEVRQYTFGSSFSVERLRQIAVPFGVVVPVGRRFSFDAGVNWARTSLRRPGGVKEEFSSFTDTQLRGSYTFGNDAVVASVMVNLPTGKRKTTQRQFGVASSTSSNFLLFPVNSFGTGFSVTPGLAAATTAGDWNLGLAASARVSSSYSPFRDTTGTYKPGVETRLRGGVDRLIGSSRMSLGVTFSTFSNDELRGGAFGNGTFDPGNRFLVDFGVVSPVGGGTVGIYAWNYHRTRSGSAGTGSTAGGKENVFTAGLNGAFSLSSRLALEPAAEARIWSPQSGSGYLIGAGTGLRIDATPRFAIVPSFRFDFGSIKTTDGVNHSVTGWDASALIRYGL
jgi:hypothetical protein